MSDNADRWKEKYLAGLEQQEAIDARWQARLDLMRRGLVRSSLAAEGADAAVDQCMHSLREVLRQDDIDKGLSGLIPRLEKAVLDSEKNRHLNIEKIDSALLRLASQLLELELPRDLRKSLKDFSRRLEKRQGHSSELPGLLAELSHLQNQTLAAHTSNANEPARQPLLARLFGGRQSAPLVSAPDSAPLVQADATAEPVAGSAESVQAEIAAVPANGALDSLPMPADSLLVAPTALPAAESSDDASPEQAETADAQPAAPEAEPEQVYSLIANHVEHTLLKLLTDLPLPEQHQQQAEMMRERILVGLNMYELVPILEDLAVLMLAIADVSQHEFEGYLKQLNERLESFQGSLQEAQEGHDDASSAARDLDTELREQVSGLNTSVQEATDLRSLKEVVDSRLNGLLGTLSEHQQKREDRDRGIAEHLRTLVERVAKMEQEALGFQEHIEKQRQRSLLDTLTGIPNRAAWNERLELEVARWQRYGGELLLAVIDIDLFKRINDDYGHLAGDRVLKIIAKILNKRLRQTDFMARYGGEEFVVLMPATSLDSGIRLVNLLRTSVEACPFHFKGERVTITLSAGISAFSPGDQADQVFERADQALYRAKRAGRNRVVKADSRA
ncbi:MULTISPECIES: diguanylate cyclase [Pseudomonas]|uniref:GGDEF domain-containing protein n=1 Tax=Pseudomonas TaxID=286 RepID=UPI00300305F1